MPFQKSVDQTMVLAANLLDQAGEFLQGRPPLAPDPAPGPSIGAGRSPVKDRPVAGLSGPWYLDRRHGLQLARCRPLDGIPGVAHACSTRQADASAPFDLGPATTRDERLLARRQRLRAAAGLAGELFMVQQVHGDAVLPAGSAQPGDRADGIWLDPRRHRQWAPTVRTADCVPLLLAARGGQAVAAVHAGWRGTAAGIAQRAVAALAAAGVAPGELVVALGPAILACCYQVGPEAMAAVAAAAAPRVGRRCPGAGSRFLLDLHAANRIQLERAGVVEVHAAPWCTRCRTDLFFSYRAEGEQAGRQAAAIGASLTVRAV